MKFVPCETLRTESIEEISSDEDNDRKQDIILAKRSFPSKPLVIRVPFISILIEEQPHSKQYKNQQKVITLEESDEQDLYVIPTQKPALINSQQQEVSIVQYIKKIQQKVQTCTICLLDIKVSAAKICCGHIFCGQCIIKSSKISNKCPNCRARFKKIIIGSKIVHVKNKSYEQQIDFEEEPCYVCGLNDRFQELLVCDHCQFAFCHASCDNRLQGRFPNGNWYCLDCTMMGRHLY